jgi:putative flippase GtrA
LTLSEENPQGKPNPEKVRKQEKIDLKRILDLNLLRVTKFAIIGFTSFLVVEAALAFFTFLGLIALYATPLAYEVSIFYGFALNDKFTVKDKGPFSLASRIVRFNLVYIAGIILATIVVVALSSRGMKPLEGNIFGALVAFPVNYFVSMILVWKQKVK